MYSLLQILLTLFAIYGLFTLLTHLARLSKSIYRHFIRKELDLRARYGQCWVAITGATDGIGKEFAIQFAKRGFNICLISRSQEKLDQAASEIRKYHSVETKTIQADFLKSFEAGFFERIVCEMQDLDVGVLVNNVGIKDEGPLQWLEKELVRDVVAVNVMAQVMMTKMMIDKLVKRTKRSAIINLSSIMGELPHPGFATYSSSKAFNQFFSLCMSEEVKENVDVMSVKPGVTITPMGTSLIRKVWDEITAKDCVEGVLKQLGRERETNGHWRHALSSYLASRKDKVKYGDIVFRWSKYLYGKRTQAVKKDQ